MNQETKTVRDILNNLVAVQSDTNTAMEIATAEAIAKYFEDDPYFRVHPNQWGIDARGDYLKRPVVWALKKGKTAKTVILTGHYDAVEIDCYGDLKAFALKPDELKAEILRRDMGDEKIKNHLQDDRWVFGRGTADMKGGLTVGIHKILNYPENAETGILFAAVADEENVSSGTRNAVGILLDVKQKFQLDYKAILILEPQLPLDGDEFLVYNGSIGKILPMIVAKGKLSHCGEPLKGLNAAHLIGQIVGRLDLNTDLVTGDFGLESPVPIVQFMRDMKNTYDVSVPEYAAAGLNLLFLGSEKTGELLERIEKICEDAVGAVMKKYWNAAKSARVAGMIAEEDLLHCSPKVMKLSQLEALAAEKDSDFLSFKSVLEEEMKRKIDSRAITLQTASMEYMKAVIEASGEKDPLIVIGVAPPYYPAVCNEYLDVDAQRYLKVLEQTLAEKYQLKMKAMPYFTGVGDCSYMSCRNVQAERQVMSNMTLPAAVYDIPFESSAQLGAPCFYLGPRGEQIHQWSERVYMPDLEEVVPSLIASLIKAMDEE
ncbi:MAG: M20/M25/M40 family metallo-hydrolase [Firmicutes bacterium]|nr:M20/M25/M40 family metallo-hydrolase [Bacillota bacterium]